MKQLRHILSVGMLIALVSSAGAQSWLTNGLVAYYPFNGNANDESGNGIGMTNSGASFVSDRFGNTQTALDLQNGAFLQSTKNLPYFGNSDRTYSAWIYVVSPAVWPAGQIIQAEGNGTPLSVVSLQLRPEGYFSSAYPVDTLAMDAGYGDTEAAIGLSPSTSKWIHIVWEYRGNLGASQFYANGQAVSTHVGRYGDASTTLNSAAGPLRFGYQFNGYLDDVRIYNRALSSNEVAQLYALEAPVPPSITLQPQSLTAVAGSSTNLSVSATGSELLTYQWLKDGVALPGATNATLVFSNLQPVSVGDYLAVVSNGGGSVTSSVASVSIPGVNSGLWQGLVAYYPFNGNANDESGFGQNATVAGPTQFWADRFGKPNGALRVKRGGEFVSGSVNLPDNPETAKDTVTYSLWFQPDADIINSSASDTFCVILNGGPNYHPLFFQITQLPGYAFGPPLRVYPWRLAGDSNVELTPDKWEHLCLVADGTHAIIYQNGVAKWQTDNYYNNSIHPVINLGNFSNVGYHSARGAFDDTRIYNRALSSNEVAQLYALEAPVPPTFMLQPQSLTAVAGSSTNLGVTATGSELLTYQWLKDGVALPGATYTTLAFTNLQPVNVGDYAAVVSNGGGSVTSSVASVSIPGVNSGLWQGLVAYYPFNGTYDDFSGVKNHLILSRGSAPYVTNRFGIPNSAILCTFAELITTTEAGMPEGSADFAISIWARLDGRAGFTEGTAQPDNHRVFFANQIINGCQLGLWDAESQNPIPEFYVGGPSGFGVPNGTPRGAYTYYAWHHVVAVRNSGTLEMYVDGSPYAFGPDSAPITSDPALRRMSFGRRSNGDHAWTGELDDIRIYNRALSSNDVAALYQTEVPPPTPPAITQNPTDVVATALSPVEFTTAAYSFYPFTYQWQLNGTNLLYATNSTLSILSARQSNVGQYTLTASNAYGSVTSSAANLFLYPYLNAPFTGVVTYWGQTNTLSVGAWGSGSLAYQWYFNGTAIAGATNTTLPLGGIQFTNAGQYSVVVSNSLGSVTNTPYQVVVNPANISLGLFAGVIIQGTVGYSYTIQATTDLSTTNSWATVTNITLADPIQIWFDGSSDVHSAGNPQKFYQVIPGQ